MITAKDIHRKKFEKVKLGYDPVDVDAFLTEVEDAFRTMEQELTDSNDKLQILADKVREYKDTEEDLKNALIGAQKQAREVIADANARAEQIEEEARSRGKSVQAQAVAEQEEQLQEISERLSEENAALVATERRVASFKKALFEMYKTHLEQISSIPESAEDLESEEEDGLEPGEDSGYESASEEPEEAEEPEEEPADEDDESHFETMKSSEDAFQESSKTPDDLFSGESRRSRKNEKDDMEKRYDAMKFDSRRDDKRRR